VSRAKIKTFATGLSGQFTQPTNSCSRFAFRCLSRVADRKRVLPGTVPKHVVWIAASHIRFIVDLDELLDFVAELAGARSTKSAVARQDAQ
jgi:hypothetical protein